MFWFDSFHSTLEITPLSFRTHIVILTLSLSKGKDLLSLAPKTVSFDYP